MILEQKRDCSQSTVPSALPCCFNPDGIRTRDLFFFFFNFSEVYRTLSYTVTSQCNKNVNREHFSGNTATHVSKAKTAKRVYCNSTRSVKNDNLHLVYLHLGNSSKMSCEDEPIFFTSKESSA